MEEITYKGKVVARVDTFSSPKKIKILNKKLFKEMQKNREELPTPVTEEEPKAKSSVFKKMFSWL